MAKKYKRKQRVFLFDINDPTNTLGFSSKKVANKVYKKHYVRNPRVYRSWRYE